MCQTAFITLNTPVPFPSISFLVFIQFYLLVFSSSFPHVIIQQRVGSCNVATVKTNLLLINSPCKIRIKQNNIIFCRTSDLAGTDVIRHESNQNNRGSRQTDLAHYRPRSHWLPALFTTEDYSDVGSQFASFYPNLHTLHMLYLILCSLFNPPIRTDTSGIKCFKPRGVISRWQHCL